METEVMHLKQEKTSKWANPSYIQQQHVTRLKAKTKLRFVAGKVEGFPPANALALLVHSSKTN